MAIRPGRLAAKGEVLLAAMLDDLNEKVASFIAEDSDRHRLGAIPGVLR